MRLGRGCSRGLAWLRAEHGGSRVVTFLGSNLGNATPTERAALLTDIATTLRPGDGFLFSVDLRKPAGVLDTCYNDPLGHRAFAEFRLNHLTHVNRRFDADFAVGQYRPRAHFVEETGMVEGHLYAQCDQQVRLPRLDMGIEVRRGESINVGFSAKFDADRLDEELAGHGMTVEHRWLDPEWQYAILLARCERSQPEPMAPLEVTAGRRSRSASSVSASVTAVAQTWPGSPSICRRTGSLPDSEPSTTARKTVPGSWSSCGCGPPAPVTATPRSASSRSRTPTPIARAASALTTGPSATCSTECLTSLA